MMARGPVAGMVSANNTFFVRVNITRTGIVIWWWDGILLIGKDAQDKNVGWKNFNMSSSQGSSMWEENWLWRWPPCLERRFSERKWWALDWKMRQYLSGVEISRLQYKIAQDRLATNAPASAWTRRRKKEHYITPSNWKSIVTTMPKTKSSSRGRTTKKDAASSVVTSRRARRSTEEEPSPKRARKKKGTLYRVGVKFVCYTSLERSLMLLTLHSNVLSWVYWVGWLR